MRYDKTIILLLILSLYSNAYIITYDENGDNIGNSLFPVTYDEVLTEGLGEYIMIERSPAHTNVTCTVKVSEWTLNPFNKNVIADGAVMSQMSTVSQIYQNNLYGWYKDDSIEAGDYVMYTTCNGYGDEYKITIRFNVQVASGTNFFNNIIFNKLFGEYWSNVFSEIYNNYYNQDILWDELDNTPSGTGVKYVSIFIKIIFIFLKTSALLIYILVKYIYIWIVLFESYLCVLSYINVKNSKYYGRRRGFKMFMSYVKYNATTLKETITLLVSIFELFAKYTIDIVLSVARTIASMGGNVAGFLTNFIK